jgi:hypothetical protein
VKAPRWVLHPTLLAAAFVLEVALANKVEPAGFLRAFVIAVLAGIALTLACWAITRDRWLGGLAATTLVLATISTIPFFFLWQALHDAFGPTLAAAVFGLIGFGVMAVAVEQRFRVRRGAPLIRGIATFALNRFAAVLIVVLLTFHVGPDLPATIADAFRSREQVSVAPVSELPDIYVILLDGYPRADVLARRFGIDNSAFLGELSDLGFDVGTSSHSNYVYTQLTLASMFQMRHIEQIPNLAPLIGRSGAHVNVLRNALIDSPTFAALRAAGYEIVVTQPGYEHVALRNAADRVLEHGEMNDLERAVLESTWLLDPLGAVIPTLFTGPTRDRVVNAFDDLVALASEARAQPAFTWVHIPAPHLPLVLDAQGQALDLAPRRFDRGKAEAFGMTDEQFVAAYADEITYLNGRVLDTIRALQDSPTHPEPVLVLMSDHGYAFDLADVQARFGNLFAASTPSAPGLLADTPTPVNLMPILLNRFLGTDFDLSEDRYFLSPTPYQLMELTEVADPD